MAKEFSETANGGKTAAHQDASTAHSQEDNSTMNQSVELSQAVNQGPYFSHPRQFAAMVANSFDRFDLNQNGEISKIELDARTNSSAPLDDLSYTARTFSTHFDQMNSLIGKKQGGFSRNDVANFAELTDPERCDSAPSFGGTMVRSTAGGAIGGGLTAKLQGDKFSDGSGKGAAVGAAVGLVAYGVEKARYNQYVIDRTSIDGWKEFTNDICNIPSNLKATPVPTIEQKPLNALSPEVRTRANMEFVTARVAELGRTAIGKPLTEGEIVTKLQNFKNEIPKIDADRDGELTFDELAEGARGDKLSQANKDLAVVLASNLEVASQLSREGLYAGSRLNHIDLETATKVYQKPTDGEVFNRRMRVGMNATTGGMIGCAAGGFIGFFAGGGVGAIPGCAGGALLLGGGAGLATNAYIPKADPLGLELGQAPVDKLRTELSFLK
jgi:Ca2+-binding EF-hand superfamily protein